MSKSDSALESDVEEELDWDPRFDNSRVQVKANDGGVILSGAVDTYYDTVLAGEDAWSVSGVTSVDNEILIAPVGEVILDADIAAKCVGALDMARFVPEGAVTADVSNGWVTLAGEVHHQYQREAASGAVSRVAGVMGVTNDVIIRHVAMPSDVVRRINKAFKRDAIIDDSLIDVTTDGNTVYLSGSVGSWYAMDDAVDTAWQAPGVVDVVNQLVIVP